MRRGSELAIKLLYLQRWHVICNIYKAGVATEAAVARCPIVNCMVCQDFAKICQDCKSYMAIRTYAMRRMSSCVWASLFVACAVD